MGEATSSLKRVECYFKILRKLNRWTVRSNNPYLSLFPEVCAFHLCFPSFSKGQDSYRMGDFSTLLKNRVSFVSVHILGLRICKAGRRISPPAPSFSPPCLTVGHLPVIFDFFLPGTM